ncbi:unnamed protein product [Tetraodon nigroviridis]|uniref:(spotted green pufferfish) hypothetical protein n=1 Tax=Tetraodon nigroviridis TaxID=99883 RepID=Q4RDR9_TETNG|nr:unnamed protein product [Tetraodon nigroviridis]
MEIERKKEAGGEMGRWGKTKEGGYKEKGNLGDGEIVRVRRGRDREKGETRRENKLQDYFICFLVIIFQILYRKQHVFLSCIDTTMAHLNQATNMKKKILT